MCVDGLVLSRQDLVRRNILTLFMHEAVLDGCPSYVNNAVIRHLWYGGGGGTEARLKLLPCYVWGGGVWGGGLYFACAWP